MVGLIQSTRQQERKSCNCIVTIRVSKTEFDEIELSGVDPKMCFKHLNGVGSSNLVSIKAVSTNCTNHQPVMSLSPSE